MFDFEYSCKICEQAIKFKNPDDPFPAGDEMCCGGIRHGGHYCAECCPNHKTTEVNE